VKKPIEVSTTTTYVAVGHSNVHTWTSQNTSSSTRPQRTNGHYVYYVGTACISNIWVFTIHL